MPKAGESASEERVKSIARPDTNMRSGVCRVQVEKRQKVVGPALVREKKIISFQGGRKKQKKKKPPNKAPSSSPFAGTA